MMKVPGGKVPSWIGMGPCGVEREGAGGVAEGVASGVEVEVGGRGEVEVDEDVVAHSGVVSAKMLGIRMRSCNAPRMAGGKAAHVRRARASKPQPG